MKFGFGPKAKQHQFFFRQRSFCSDGGKALYKISPSSLFVDTLNSQLLYEQEDKGVAVCEGCQRQFFGYDKDGKLVEVFNEQAILSLL